MEKSPTLKEYIEFKNTYVDCIFLRELPWRSRILLETIDDLDLLCELKRVLSITDDSYTPEDLDKTFSYLRQRTEAFLQYGRNCENLPEKFDYMSRAMIYDGILESLNELSTFSNKLIEKIKNKFGERFFEVIESVDRANLSVDVAKFKECEKDDSLPNDVLIEKYLVLKKWQDKQHNFYINEIEPYLWNLEKEYLQKYNHDEIIKINNPQLLRKFNNLISKKIVNIDEIAKCYLAGFEQELITLFGGKAFGLAILRSRGIKIPLTDVVPMICTDVISEADLSFRSAEYAVRSSADIEDGTKYSFAGLFDTRLGVTGNNIGDEVQFVKQSVNNKRAQEYIKINNLHQPRMAVIIQPYIEPIFSGVWVGSNIDSGMLEYVRGSGDKLVSGVITPQSESWINSRILQGDALKTVTGEPVGERLISIQKLVFDVADFEWCIIDGDLLLLQYRPVTTSMSAKNDVREYTENGEEIFSGIAASSGFAQGHATYIRLINEFDMDSWRNGDILMAWFTEPEWMSILTRCSGIVTAVGGFLCHAAIIARELGIPCVIGIGQNMKKIWDKEYIAVDGSNGKVYTIKKESISFE